MTALRDPERCQLAHIAVLDAAMAVRKALERRGAGEAEIARVTEEISAFVRGEADRLTAEPLCGGEWELLGSKSREPAFCGIFGSPSEQPGASREREG